MTEKRVVSYRRVFTKFCSLVKRVYVTSRDSDSPGGIERFAALKLQVRIFPVMSGTRSLPDCTSVIFTAPWLFCWIQTCKVVTLVFPEFVTLKVSSILRTLFARAIVMRSWSTMTPSSLAEPIGNNPMKVIRAIRIMTPVFFIWNLRYHRLILYLLFASTVFLRDVSSHEVSDETGWKIVK